MNQTVEECDGDLRAVSFLLAHRADNSESCNVSYQRRPAGGSAAERIAPGAPQRSSHYHKYYPFCSCRCESWYFKEKDGNMKEPKGWFIDPSGFEGRGGFSSSDVWTFLLLSDSIMERVSLPWCRNTSVKTWAGSLTSVKKEFLFVFTSSRLSLSCWSSENQLSATGTVLFKDIPLVSVTLMRAWCHTEEHRAAAARCSYFRRRLS